MIEEHLALPFLTRFLAVETIVEKVGMNRDDQIAAVCGQEGLVKQRIEILDLSLPEPIPASAEGIAANCHWRKRFSGANANITASK
jgi:hypothetical protein